MKLRAIHTSTSLVYSETDLGTGRCRLSATTILNLKVGKIGAIVRLRLKNDETYFEVLCTVWPDQSNTLNADDILIDDAVIIDPSASWLTWLECDCEIMEARQSVPISSFSVVNRQAYLGLQAVNLLGMPLTNGCSVKSLTGTGRGIIISRISPTNHNIRSIGVVYNNTMLVNDTIKLQTPNPYAHNNTNKMTVNNTSLERVCSSNISVVQEIVKRVINSCVDNTPFRTRLTGLLLLGPPGVGKTYAVKAVQQQCIDRCKIHIFDMNIPTLLSESDPLAALHALFSSIANLKRKHGDKRSDGSSRRNNDDSTVAVSPMNSPAPVTYNNDDIATTGGIKNSITSPSSCSVTESLLSTPSMITANDTKEGSASVVRFRHFAPGSSSSSSAVKQLSTKTTSSVTAATTPLTNKKSNSDNSNSSSSIISSNQSYCQTPTTTNSNHDTSTASGSSVISNSNSKFSFSRRNNSSQSINKTPIGVTPSSVSSEYNNNKILFSPELSSYNGKFDKSNDETNNNMIISEPFSPCLTNSAKRNNQQQQQIVEDDIPEMAFIVIDEIDALGKEGNQSSAQMVIKQFLCEWMDDQQAATASQSKETSSSSSQSSIYCCLVGTSNRAADIDSCLRRGGRLEHEIAVLNTQEDRACILQSLLRTMFGTVAAEEGSFNNNNNNIKEANDHQALPHQVQLLSTEEIYHLAAKIAMHTGGYVAADLAALVRTMRNTATESDDNHGSSNNNEKKEDAYMKLFHRAARTVTPSCLRGVSIQLPQLNYEDVIGYSEVKKSLQRVMSFSHPNQQMLMRRFFGNSSSSNNPGGVLLYGPPGNSKTRLVTAAAAYHKLPMIALSAADVYSPYVGDAEAEIRRAFQIARQAAPCVLFLDELDAIVTNRDNNNCNSGGSTSATVEGRVLATLLTEMDGIHNNNNSNEDNYDEDKDNDSNSSNKGGGLNGSSGGVIVLGATNRLDFIDAALLRKGRFHHILHVPLPNQEEQVMLLQYFAKKCKLISTEEETGNHSNIITNSNETLSSYSSKDLVDNNEHTMNQLYNSLKPGLSGAEIENMCKQAALKQYMPKYS